VYIDVLDIIFFFLIPGSIIGSWILCPEVVTRAATAIVGFVNSPTMVQFESSLHAYLGNGGVPPPYPTAMNITMVIFGSVVTCLGYFISVGRRHWEHRKDIETELSDARMKVQILEDRLHQSTKHEIKKELGGKKVVRIFMDGAFDLMHYGHMNAFRLGSELGTELVVGVNSSETIAECKGFAPILNDQERCNAVTHCRFVDETIERSPYVMTQEYLEWVIKQYNIDFVVHGDDPCLVDGEDVYGPVKAMGKFKSIPRTEGISTTDLIGRILMSAPATAEGGSPRARSNSTDYTEDNRRLLTKSESICDVTTQHSSRFMTTSSILRKFSAGMKTPPPGALIVYIDGSWDMFHSGHIDILKEAKMMGSYLIAGVFSDALVSEHLGRNSPIMTMNERMLSVIGCKLVDDVLIDAPLIVDDDMIASLRISVVVTADFEDNWSGFQDRQGCAASRGILKKLKAIPDALKLADIVRRLNDNRSRYEKKFEVKKKQEDEYYNERYQRDTMSSINGTNELKEAP